jgi:hypothetical protein
MQRLRGCLLYTSSTCVAVANLPPSQFIGVELIIMQQGATRMQDSQEHSTCLCSSISVGCTKTWHSDTVGGRKSPARKEDSSQEESHVGRITHPLYAVVHQFSHPILHPLGSYWSASVL